MKSTHRTQAKAKRSQHTHYVMTYGLLDTLFASPDAPMPAEKRRHQLTRMYGGLRAMETAPAPTRDDWRVVSDAVNLMETLVKDMRLCEDPGGLLEDAVAALAALFATVYTQERRALGGMAPEAEAALQMGFVKVYAALLVTSAVVAWWLVLKHKSAQVAQEESNRQTLLLVQEIESHRRTDEALQQAKQVADSANQAKSRYISAISHELRTPLNSILGYAQLLDDDPSIPEARRQAVRVIKRGGDHLLSLIEGTLDIARIEAGKLTLDVAPMRLADGLHEMADLFVESPATQPPPNRAAVGVVAREVGGRPDVVGGVRAERERKRESRGADDDRAGRDCHWRAEGGAMVLRHADERRRAKPSRGALHTQAERPHASARDGHHRRRRAARHHRAHGVEGGCVSDRDANLDGAAVRAIVDDVENQEAPVVERPLGGMRRDVVVDPLLRVKRERRAHLEALERRPAADARRALGRRPSRLCA